MKTGPAGLKTYDHQVECVRASFAFREYKPVVAAALIDADARVMLIRSLRCPKEWTLVEGDIDLDEQLADATRRTVSEGVGLAMDPLRAHDIGRVIDVDALSPRTVPKGFTKGMRFFGRVFDYEGPPKIEPGPSTAVAYIWCPLDGLEAKLAKSTPWRRKLILDILSR